MQVGNSWVKTDFIVCQIPVGINSTNKHVYAIYLTEDKLTVKNRDTMPILEIVTRKDFAEDVAEEDNPTNLASS